MSDDESIENTGEELQEQDTAVDTRQDCADGGNAAGDSGAIDTSEQTLGQADTPGQGETVTQDDSKNSSNETQNASRGDAVAVAGSSKINSREDDDRKIFVGGLHWETTANDLKEYFSKYGTVVDCTLKTDMATGKSRGFGFVLFEDVTVVDKVMEDKKHSLHDRDIDPKRAQARGSGATTTKAEPSRKVFVGGLSPDLPEADIKAHFEQYGKVEEIELPFDKLKNQRRAFCFITFESVSCVEKAVVLAKQKLGDNEVDVRKATPKSEQEGNNSRAGASRGGYSNPGYYGGQGYAPPGYDYSAYYSQPGYGYGAYPGYGGYDYSAYYGGQDWSGYGQGYAYPGYDYSGYYSGYGYDQNSQAGAAGGAGAAAASYKAKRGDTSSPGGTAGYHPYSR